MTDPEQPTYAERARTALARATTGSLLTSARGSVHDLTSVSLDDQPDGSPIVRLPPDSPVVERITTCPVATLVVPGPTDAWVLHLVGTWVPLAGDRGGGAAPCGCLGYRASLLGARLVGPARVSIPLDRFRQARPDPVRDEAATTLRHLEEAHGAELLACVRAHGHEALAVVPRQVDRNGIDLVALGTEGVDRLRLAFPVDPVDSLDRLSSWRLPTSCRCHGV